MLLASSRLVSEHGQRYIMSFKDSFWVAPNSFLLCTSFDNLPTLLQEDDHGEAAGGPGDVCRVVKK